jgi:SAM-dependent methyltransferase
VISIRSSARTHRGCHRPQPEHAHRPLTRAPNVDAALSPNAGTAAAESVGSGQNAAVTWDFLRSSYDVVADSYDATFDDELAGKPRDRELLLGFAASTQDPIADVGCGPGHIGRSLRDAGRHVIGLDLSSEMTKRAHGRLTVALVADMRSLPIAAAGLGGIVAFYSLIHLPRSDVVPLLREFHRALRPGGRVRFSAHEGEGVLQVVTAEIRPSYPSEHPTDRI